MGGAGLAAGVAAMRTPKRWTAIALLVACSAVVQALVIGRAALPALDSLRSVAAAEALIRSPSLATLAEEPEQPLFPVWLAFVHSTLGALATPPGRTATDWTTSVQLAAAAPLVLWPAPVYWFSRRRFGPRAAFLAGLLACLLPTAAQLGGEGLPDALYLMLFTSAIALLPLQRPSNGCNVAAGIAIGLAMLVRVEAALLVAVVGVASFFRPRFTWRPRIRHWRRQTAMIGAGVGIVLLPFLAGTQSLSPREVLVRLTARTAARDGWVFNAKEAEFPSHAKTFPADGYSFDSKERAFSARRFGLFRALTATADELLVATGFVLLPLVALASIQRWLACDRLALTGSLVWVSLGFANAVVTGYLSSRHLLPVAVFLLPAAGRRLAGTGAGKRVGSDSRAWLRALTLPAPGAWRGAVTVVLFVVWAWWCWLPLHADRAGHREAGQWLRGNTEAEDRVLDTWGWSALASGRPTYRYDAALEAFSDPRLRYVIVEQRELDTGTSRAATLRRLLARHAECVAEFAASDAQSAVLIFHWRPLIEQNEGSLATRD